jgi:vesicle transport through interaction with t-SNAREs protein 1
MKGPEKKRCQTKSAQYKSDLAALRRTAEQARLRPSHNGSASTNGTTAAAVTRAQRQQAADDSLARTGATLQDSVRVLASSEDIGGSVLSDLESQRQSLLRARGHVVDVSGDAGEARQLLQAIARRNARHRLMLYCIIAGLLVAIAIVLYFKFR